MARVGFLEMVRPQVIECLVMSGVRLVCLDLFLIMFCFITGQRELIHGL